jgi:1,2-beta-oligoglucan phosphorylase
MSHSIDNGAGLRFEFNDNGSLRHLWLGDVHVNSFVGNEVEGGPANLWLRTLDGRSEAVPLLGPQSPLRFVRGKMHAVGQWQGLGIRLALRLAAGTAAWFWHLRIDNVSATPCTFALTHVQDLGLAPYGAIRTNEYYVSHYIDLAPLQHREHGWMVAARQNQDANGKNPWAIVGSLRRGASFATDALQVLGLAARTGASARGLTEGLPGTRLQHEHALAAIEDEPVTLAPGAGIDLGFFGCVQAHHPLATSADDLAAADALRALPEASPPAWADADDATTPARTLFSTAPLLAARDLDARSLDALFTPTRRHEERNEQGALLSFFHADDAHVVLRAKEVVVKRAHGHLLRSGAALEPDEAALTSTPWMAGVFHSMVTQGHVGINRFLSTVRGGTGQFRAHGLRLFVEIDGRWQLLGVPSAFETRPQVCRWLYALSDGTLIEVTADAATDAHVLGLRARVLKGAALKMLATLHVALGDDDGETGGAAVWCADAQGVFVAVPPGSGLARRFPQGGFRIEPASGSRFGRVGGDELLFEDGASRAQPFVCIGCDATREFAFTLRGELIADANTATAAPLSAPRWHSTDAQAAQLADAMPWYLHNALVHYLSPRGLEQFTGGGWGTRDVCQGPLEMLLALGRTAPARDLLLRVFAAQNADGDWPQWFMFFERERDIRAGDSHGDIVFWPLLATARYLLATEDGALLDAPVPFHEGERASVWQHMQRALAVIGERRIAGTHLAAYGHGDWNDSLQPVDPASRERLCSAWTVTLHHQVLTTLARALHAVGRHDDAAPLEAKAGKVLADFQRLLVADGVVAGYAQFEPDRAPQLLLHPRDTTTGVRYSLLPMMHAAINDMLSPQQAAEHLQLIEQHLLGPDGARLFDRPLPYRGGPQQLFKRAESAAFFGREIGVMYMHAHLRYAEMLAHLGHAERFFDALCKAHPILLTERVPTSDRRQSNCYYSSSDAAFPDRYEASERYDDIAHGHVALDGGWRIYSSGPGIALALVVEHWLGIRQEKSTLVVDPVLPQRLDGLRATLTIAQREVELLLQTGPRGHGPQRVELNGHSLAFTRGTNPYRTGAAEVPMQSVQSVLQPTGNRLTVRVG